MLFQGGYLIVPAGHIGAIALYHDQGLSLSFDFIIDIDSIHFG
jgi:hypothetical protein